LAPATTNHLFLRTRNTEGSWSITAVKQFAVSITADPAYPAAPAPPGNIVAAEYFIDTDAGHGSGTAVNISAAANISNANITLPVTGLTNGLHRLFIRSKNNEGRWSIANTAAFYTDPISLSADSLLYGNVPLSTTVYKNLIITNDSNTSQTINAVTVGAPFTSNFSTVRTVAAGASDTIRVDFTPTSAGMFIQPIQLQTSAGNYSAGLRGNGVTQVPSWTISPATGHDYGAVPLNTTPSFNFTIQNTGNIPATLSNVTTTNGAFVAGFTAGTVVPVNGSTSISVGFTPVVVGPYNSQLKIESSTAGVNFVTTNVTGSGFNPGAAPVLQFLTGSPYNSNTGVNPAAGQAGNYVY
ncbi:MAG: choice-of-anchor D domain-containing protein, partial [Sphingobacteriales bacterium]